MLLVHGSNADQRIWDEHGDRLAQRYRVLALTQRYFGTTAWPDDGRGFSLENHAADLATFLRGLGEPPVTLVGWSYGAGVCLAMAARHPTLAGRLFLYEPALATFVTAPEQRERAQHDRLEMIAEAKAASGAGQSDAAVELFMDGVNDAPGTFRGLPEAIRTMMVENGRMLPLLFAAPPPPPVTCEELGRITIPTIIALGAASRAFYSIAARAAAGCIPHARLVVVPDARHLWPIQDPPGFCQLVSEVLQ